MRIYKKLYLKISSHPIEVITVFRYFVLRDFVIRVFSNSPFCVPAKVIKLVGLKNGGRISPTSLVTFVDTQNGE